MEGAVGVQAGIPPEHCARSGSVSRGWRMHVQENLVHIQEKVPSREEFPLPTLGPKLEALREEVRIGRGFQLLR